MRATLQDAAGPLSRTALRQRLRVNNSRLGDTLLELEHHGLAVRDRHGWRLPNGVVSRLAEHRTAHLAEISGARGRRYPKAPAAQPIDRPALADDRGV